MTQHVPVGKDGLFALVDDEDYALVSQYKWYVTAGGYAAHSYSEDGKSKALLIHRLILGLGPEDPDVDHVNHAKMDNRRCNLRLATASQNGGNARKTRRDTASHYKGVYWKRARQRWLAQISIRGKNISLRLFDAEAEAAHAYDSAAAHFFGEFACLNFPDSPPAPYMPRRSHSSTCRGVCYRPTRTSRNKWCARIMCNGKRYCIGHFLTEQAAIAALQTYRRDHNL